MSGYDRDGGREPSTHWLTREGAWVEYHEIDDCHLSYILRKFDRDRRFRRARGVHEQFVVAEARRRNLDPAMEIAIDLLARIWWRAEGSSGTPTWWSPPSPLREEEERLDEDTKHQIRDRVRAVILDTVPSSERSMGDDAIARALDWTTEIKQGEPFDYVADYRFARDAQEIERLRAYLEKRKQQKVLSYANLCIDE